MIPKNLPQVLRPIFEQAVKKAMTPCKGCQERREAVIKRINKFRLRNRAVKQVEVSNGRET